MCVLLFDAFNGCSLIRKLIGKGMSNIYYCEKLAFSKLGGKVNFSERKFEEMHYLRRAKRHKIYSGKRLFGTIVFSCLSSTKPCLRFLLVCFAREIKGFYQIYFGNEVDFRDIMNVYPNILGET